MSAGVQSGEAAGFAAALAMQTGVTPAAQYFGAQGFFAGYDARPDAPLCERLAGIWAAAFVRLRNGKHNPQKLARVVTAAEAEPPDAPIATSRFLTLIRHPWVEQDHKPLTRGEACRLMFQLLETKSSSPPAPGD